MIGAMIDVTDRKERENALAFFRSLLDQATDAIEIIDPASARFRPQRARPCRSRLYP
ncbi:MAG: hypothetical protein U0231_11215 [Nitrospiraceae bacterium]